MWRSRDQLRTVGRDRVLHVVGPAQLRQLGVTPRDLLAGAWDEFAFNARLWVRGFLIERGDDRLAADEYAASIAAQLAETLTEFMLEHLHDGFPRLANNLRVSHDLVASALGQIDLIAVG